MRVDSVSCSGFIMQGQLSVMINSQIEDLGAGDGFVIAAGHPYRFRNTTDSKAIIVFHRSQF